ncbi:hypothetical protein JIG36_22025 [Actinoplanes sp. LDG1-06]|uniref:Uncharacterized protein n=1 Tax=Paractinoplanes ovalisporus TaxID=2810368 RepID=A0ABS2AEK0_9ACTN|nr:hypothetical protein [Actinoplanes ovalisporus]MBM2618241.1 hypothetical protein [Actinoplanes ovalisporus]
MRRILVPLLLSGVLLAGGACAAQPGAAQAIDTLLVSADQQMGALEEPADVADDLRAAGSKRSVAERVDRRLKALERFDATIEKAKNLQPAHKEALGKLVDEQKSGLTALRDKTGKDAARSVVVDFRVFILTGPKVRLATAIDAELAAAAELDDREGAAKVEKILNGQVDALLAIKPGPDAAAIKKQIEPIRTAAKEARTTLKALR